MEVFFIRHGQSTANVRHVHQHPDTPLTDLGHEQAAAAAKRLRDFNPTRIISSPSTRAFDTARAIGAELGLPVVTNQVFMELKRPKYVYGYSHFHPRSLWYIAQWFFKWRDPSWRDLGGESYEMFIDRIQEGREYLETFGQHERIVVVSHSIFINFFVEHVCNERKLSLWEALLRLTKIVVLDNTSITHVEYDHSDNPNLCTWNTLEFDDDGHVVK